jgi:GntR family transcriptional repressor for pyruvate dehydrogenase complex
MLEKIQNNTPKLPELVMKSILNAILSGQIKVNQELQPERELAAALGVGRGSLRECLSILEFLGIIETKGNRKVVIKDADAIMNAISIIRLSDRTDYLLDFVEFRRTIESSIAEFACERATEEDINIMKNSIERLEKNPDDFEADLEFHINLAKASHNPIFASVLAFVNSMLLDVRFRLLSAPDYKDMTALEHRNILAAIVNKDKIQAKEQINIHLDSIEKFVKQYDGV